MNKRAPTVDLSLGLHLPEQVRQVEMCAKGHERTIAPVGRHWDSFFLDGPTVSDDFSAARDNPPQSDREPF